MKKIITSKMTRKCLVLAFLIIGLVFVVSSNKITQPVAAAECCDNCPGSGDPAATSDACNARCTDPTDASCYNDCAAEANFCYRHCVICTESLITMTCYADGSHGYYYYDSNNQLQYNPCYNVICTPDY